jgi:molybdate transport system substrate-binding protein
MKLRSLLAASTIGLAFLSLLAGGVAARAAEVKVLSAVPMRAVMEELGPKFERASGHRLAMTFNNLGNIVKRVQDGEAADVVILPRQGIDGLLRDGKASAGNVTEIARAGFGVAVRKGGSRPDISSPEALKRALLAARSITYGNPAAGSASGAYFVKVLDRLGIAEEMKSKTVFPSSGAPEVLVANGDIEIAVNHVVQLVQVAGIEVVGPLPGDLQGLDVYAAAILAGARDAEASKALVDFLRRPEAAAVIRAKGMESATP